MTNGKPIKSQLGRTFLIFNHMLYGVQSTNCLSFRISSNPLGSLHAFCFFRAFAVTRWKVAPFDFAMSVHMQSVGRFRTGLCEITCWEAALNFVDAFKFCLKISKKKKTDIGPV